MLTGRNNANQHSIKAITGLQKELDEKAIIKEYVKNTEYKKDTLIYVGGLISRVVADYTSANETGNIDVSYEKDIEDKKIFPICQGGSGSGDAILEKDITSNVTVGAAPSGSFFNKNMSFTQFAEKILRTDVNPTIKAEFSGTGTYEKGHVINGTTMKLTITNPGSITVSMTGAVIKFYVGNTVVDTKNYIAGTNSYSFAYNQQIKIDTTVKAELVVNGKNFNGTGNFKFIYASYYGKISGDIDLSTANSIISAWTINNSTGVKNIGTGSYEKKLIGSKALNRTGINLNDEKFYYMYPESFGALSSILDGNGFDQLDGYTINTFSLTTTNGDTVSYKIYTLTDPTTGTGFVQKYS